MTTMEAEGSLNEFMAEARNVIVAGIRADGRPHMTPNWFLWDGDRFYISTTKGRAKFRIFGSDPRVQLLIDDSTDFRYVVVDGMVEISDDIEDGFGYFKALRNKHGHFNQTDDELRDEMVRDERVLLIVTPDKPQSEWHQKGF